MKIDFGTKLKDLKGIVIKRGEAELTLGDVAVDGLMMADAEKKEDAKKKCECYKLACRVSDSKEPLEITSEEAVLIKEKVNSVHGPLIVGQVYEIIK